MTRSVRRALALALVTGTISVLFASNGASAVTCRTIGAAAVVCYEAGEGNGTLAEVLTGPAAAAAGVGYNGVTGAAVYPGAEAFAATLVCDEVTQHQWLVLNVPVVGYRATDTGRPC